MDFLYIWFSWQKPFGYIGCVKISKLNLHCLHNRTNHWLSFNFAFCCIYPRDRLSCLPTLPWCPSFYVCSYSTKQWAAVTTQRGETMEPPQTCLPLQCKLTCHPHSSSAASVPPTIRRPSPTRSRQSVCEKISSMKDLRIQPFIKVLLFYCSNWTRIPVNAHLAYTLTWVTSSRAVGRCV